MEKGELERILSRAADLEFLNAEEGEKLFREAPLTTLMEAAHALREKKKPGNHVTWIIDRNVNTTNICVANCKFCNFFRPPGHEQSYITTREEYMEKIDETIRLG